MPTTARCPELYKQHYLEPDYTFSLSEKGLERCLAKREVEVTPELFRQTGQASPTPAGPPALTFGGQDDF